MTRPDSALALAVLYGLDGLREMKVGGVTVTENSLGAAAYADIVWRFYNGEGPLPNGNQMLRVGLGADKKLPPDSAMVQAVFARKNGAGEPIYKPMMKRVADTSEVSAMLKNSLSFFEDGQMQMILSAPATYMARTYGYAGALDGYKAKVKNLIVTDVKQDPVAMRRVLTDWPTGIVFVSRKVATQLIYPNAAFEEDFAWSKAHPVADFVRAFKPNPLGIVGPDMAAALFSVRPTAHGFSLSDPGNIVVANNGNLTFVPSPTGKHKQLVVDPTQQDSLLKTIRQLASAKPVVRTPQRRRTPEEIAAEAAANAAAAAAAAAQQK
jgi:hypothetical protein